MINLAYCNGASLNEGGILLNTASSSGEMQSNFSQDRLYRELWMGYRLIFMTDKKATEVALNWYYLMEFIKKSITGSGSFLMLSALGMYVGFFKISRAISSSSKAFDSKPVLPTNSEVKSPCL